MLAGYNQNSFGKSKPKKHKSSRTNGDKKSHDRKVKESQLTSESASRDVTSRQVHNDSTVKHKEEFAQVLDQMSMNSSSKVNQQTTTHGNIKIIPKPEKRKSSGKYESKRDHSNLNLSKSQTGLVSSILKG